MIMSPFVLDRNVPLIGLIGPPKAGQIGADRDEQERIGKGGCRSADARELPSSKAAVETVRVASRSLQNGTKAPLIAPWANSNVYSGCGSANRSAQTRSAAFGILEKRASVQGNPTRPS